MKVVSYHREFFISLIKDLREHQINYAIIGDYQNLPESINHDIDIWTDDVEKFRNVLFSTITKTCFRVLIDNKTANGCNVAYYRREEEIIYLMKIDVLVDTSWMIIPLVNKDVMKSNIMPYKDFYVANPESEALMHFLYPMFQWNYIKKEVYKTDILRYYNKPIFYKVLSSLLGDKQASVVLKMISQEKWTEIEKNMPKLKRKAMQRGLMSKCTYIKILQNIKYVVKRKIKPSGFCIAFCGLDGAGKTTIIDELNRIFVDLLKEKKVFYGYWRPFVIPEIRELFGRENSKAHIDKEAQKGVTIIQEEKKTSGILFSFIKFLYYWIDYMLANLKYGSIRERGGAVFFDRHYIDTIVYPQRFGLHISKKMVQFFYYFIPKADYTFFLYCTPDEIRKRKKEFSVKEIQQQTKDYLSAGKKIKKFIPIETNKTIAIEIDEILSHIAK